MADRLHGVGIRNTVRGDNDTAGSRIDEMSIKYERKTHIGTKLDHLKPIVPIISIDLPD